MKNSRAIILLLVANSISGISQGISMLAIPWYFTGVIHRETLFGKTYFIITTVSLLWGLYAGTLIDRHSRKRIFLVINISGLIILSAVSLFGFVTGSLPWYLVALVFATTAFIYNIHFPNLYAYAQEITPKEDYARVTSRLEIQGQLTFTISGALAAMLITGVNEPQVALGNFSFVLPLKFGAWKIHEIFALDAVTYAVAFFIIGRIKSLPVAGRKIDTGSLRERLKTGSGFLLKHLPLFHFGNLSLLVFLTILVFGTYVQPVYVDSFLHRSGNVYALGDMAFSLGALLAGFLTTKIFGSKNTVRTIIILSAVAGVMYALMAGSKLLLVFFSAQFIIGWCNAAVRIQRITYLFHHIPNSVIGRANSIFFVINVFLRLCLIALFTFPFFHEKENVVYAVALFSAICFAGSLMLRVNERRLTGVR